MKKLCKPMAGSLVLLALLLVLPLSARAAGSSVTVNAASFPDPNFRSWILEQSYGKDGVLTSKEIAAVTKIDVSYRNIITLAGIERFFALEDLECSINQLMELDVTRNTELKTLSCSANQLTELDVTQNPALEELLCSDNQLTQLDITKNTGLEILHCASNQLTELNITKNPVLSQLYCSNNPLKELDVTKKPALKYLSCGFNQLTELDVTKNSALEVLICDGNQLTELDVTKNPALIALCCNSNQLTQLDVTGNLELILLECRSNQLTSLDLSAHGPISGLRCWSNSYAIAVDGNNQFDLSKLPGSFDVSKASNWAGGNVTGTILTAREETVTYTYDFGNGRSETFTLTAELNEIPAGIAVDETNFPDANFRNWILEQTYGEDGVLTAEEIAGVTEINVWSKHITSLVGIEHFTALESLYCHTNQLRELNVTKNPALKILRCDSNNLSELDVTQNPALEVLHCYHNWLRELNVTENSVLKELICNENPLSELDVTKNPTLEVLYCYDTQLTDLDVTQNLAMLELGCSDNPLTQLDVTKNSALRILTCNSTHLTELDISQNPALFRLDCNSNQLTALDVTKNPALRVLTCSSNQLTKLDMTQNPALFRLHCESNQLTGLDLTKNVSLEYLYCDANQLTSLDLSKNTELTGFSSKRNSYTIQLNSKDQFNLSDLPGSFDASKASNWKGGNVTGTILTATEETITYTYDLGNGITETFTLQCTLHTHTEVTVEGKAPTCMETGLTEGTHCDTCGAVLTAQEIIPVAEHSYEEGKCRWCGQAGLEITSQPKSVTVEEGEKATVTFTASGEGLTYQWYYKEAGGSKFYATTAFTSNSYYVAMTEARDGRQIYCEVSDRYGNTVATNTVTISMKKSAEPVKITVQPKSVTVAEGATAKVSLQATGEGLSYRWYFKNAGDSKYTYTDTFKSNTYSVQMTAARSGRRVLCKVYDKYGNMVQSNSVTLNMAAAPAPVKITQQPVSVTVAEGQTAKVTVKATGDGLSYKWYFKNAGASKFTLTESFKSNTYSVAITADRSGRQVYCKIMDKYGNTVTTNTVTLSMAKKQTVKIVTQPVSVTVAEGQTAKVTVKATGDGLTYKWYYKNAGDTKYTYTDSFKGNTYSVTMTAARDGRRVLCKVYDKYGNMVQSNSVTINMK